MSKVQASKKGLREGYCLFPRRLRPTYGQKIRCEVNLPTGTEKNKRIEVGLRIFLRD